MRIFLITAMLMVQLFSCKKDSYHEVLPAPIPPPAERDGMIYLDLHDFPVSDNNRKSIDFDSINGFDFQFSTLRIGDPLNMQDRIEFFIGSNLECYLLFDSRDNVPAYGSGREIPLDNIVGYHWHDVGYSVLIAKIISVDTPVFWRGKWIGLQHAFVPVQRRTSAGKFNGWIELSVDTANEKIILHRAAISILPNSLVRAGE
ncbi:MAG: hypothetical protein ABWZ25_18220 [Chitinophagaceae bacterium]